MAGTDRGFGTLLLLPDFLHTSFPAIFQGHKVAGKKDHWLPGKTQALSCCHTTGWPGPQSFVHSFVVSWVLAGAGTVCFLTDVTLNTGPFRVVTGCPSASPIIFRDKIPSHSFFCIHMVPGLDRHSLITSDWARGHASQSPGPSRCCTRHC